MQLDEEFMNSIKALSKIVEEINKTVTENIPSVLANVTANIDFDYLADIGKRWNELLPKDAFSDFKYYSTENILTCANYGIGYTSCKDLDIILKQNYQSQEEADDYLQALDDNYLSDLLEYVKTNVDVYYGNNNYVKQIIDESIFNFENGKFTFCTIGLVTLFEDLGSDVGELFVGIEEDKFTETENKFFYKLKEKVEYLEELENRAESASDGDITNLSYAEYNRFLSVLTLLKKMFIKTDQADGSIPNRHEVAHRTRNMPYQKYDCIKLYILLAEILEFLMFESEED